MDITQTPDWHDALEQHLGELLVGPGAPANQSEPNTEAYAASKVSIKGSEYLESASRFQRL